MFNLPLLILEVLQLRVFVYLFAVVFVASCFMLVAYFFKKSKN